MTTFRDWLGHASAFTWRYAAWLGGGALAVLVLIAAIAATQHASVSAADTVSKLPPTGAAHFPAKPNVVFILTDDLEPSLLQFMPNVQAMQREGMSFSNYFVTNSSCCPSRASILTGQYPHNNGVLTNVPPDGGFEVFNDNGNDERTFAVALQENGYKTALLGKYLNRYEPKQHAPPPGWTEWYVGGGAYENYDYDLNQNGEVVRYGSKESDYLTDVLAGIADGFIRRSAKEPFFIEIATYAPHRPYTFARRHAKLVPEVVAPRSPAYGARPGPDAPNWLKAIPPLTEKLMGHMDRWYRKRARAVMAIDEMVGSLRETLKSLGIADRTLVVFSSDNGFHMGEYSLKYSKMTPFDIDIRVPLVVVGPGVPAGAVVNEITANTDLAPTFAALGGSPGPLEADGVSLLSLVAGEPTGAWRNGVMITHRRTEHDPEDPDLTKPQKYDPMSYDALRTEGHLCRVCVGGGQPLRPEGRSLRAREYRRGDRSGAAQALPRGARRGALVRGRRGVLAGGEHRALRARGCTPRIILGSSPRTGVRGRFAHPTFVPEDGRRRGSAPRPRRGGPTP